MKSKTGDCLFVSHIQAEGEIIMLNTEEKQHKSNMQRLIGRLRKLKLARNQKTNKYLMNATKTRHISPRNQKKNDI